MQKQEIIDKILGYINKDERGKLEILDMSPEKILGRKQKYYTGVTLSYLKQYVLKDESINDEFLMYILTELCLEDKLWTIFCSTIKKIVFEKAGMWNGNRITNIFKNPTFWTEYFPAEVELYNPYFNAYNKLQNSAEMTES
jgi:hypothetical protein